MPNPIQSISGIATGASQIVNPASTAAGSLLIFSSTTTTGGLLINSITDNKGNIWIQSGICTNNNTLKSFCWHVINATSGVTSMVITYSSSIANNAPSIFREYPSITGIADTSLSQSGTSPFEQTNTSNTLTSSSDLIICWGGMSAAQTAMAGTGFGNLIYNSNSTAGLTHVMEDQTVSTTTGVAATFTSLSVHWTCGLIAYTQSGSTSSSTFLGVTCSWF